MERASPPSLKSATITSTCSTTPTGRSAAGGTGERQQESKSSKKRRRKKRTRTNSESGGVQAAETATASAASVDGEDVDFLDGARSKSSGEVYGQGVAVPEVDQSTEKRKGGLGKDKGTGAAPLSSDSDDGVWCIDGSEGSGIPQPNVSKDRPAKQTYSKRTELVDLPPTASPLQPVNLDVVSGVGDAADSKHVSRQQLERSTRSEPAAAAAVAARDLTGADGVPAGETLPPSGEDAYVDELDNLLGTELQSYAEPEETEEFGRPSGFDVCEQQGNPCQWTTSFQQTDMPHQYAADQVYQVEFTAPVMMGHPQPDGSFYEEPSLQALTSQWHVPDMVTVLDGFPVSHAYHPAFGLMNPHLLPAALPRHHEIQAGYLVGPSASGYEATVSEDIRVATSHVLAGNTAANAMFSRSTELLPNGITPGDELETASQRQTDLLPPITTCTVSLATGTTTAAAGTAGVTTTRGVEKPGNSMSFVAETTQAERAEQHTDTAMVRNTPIVGKAEDKSAEDKSAVVTAPNKPAAGTTAVTAVPADMDAARGAEKPGNNLSFIAATEKTAAQTVEQPPNAKVVHNKSIVHKAQDKSVIVTAPNKPATAKTSKRTVGKATETKTANDDAVPKQPTVGQCGKTASSGESMISSRVKGQAGNVKTTQQPGLTDECNKATVDRPVLLGMCAATPGSATSRQLSSQGVAFGNAQGKETEYAVRTPAVEQGNSEFKENLLDLCVQDTLLKGEIVQFFPPPASRGRIRIYKSTSTSVCLQPDEVSFRWPSPTFRTGQLPPMTGDQVELKLYKMNQRNASWVRLLHCAPRSGLQVSAFVGCMLRCASGDRAGCIGDSANFSDLSGSAALWQMLGRAGESSTMDNDTLCSLLRSVYYLHRFSMYRQAPMSTAARTLIKSNLVQPSGRLAVFLRSGAAANHLLIVQEFLLLLAKSEPKSSRLLLPLCNMMVDKYASADMNRFLLSILNLTMPTCSESVFQMWRNLPLICIPEEVMSDDDCQIAKECLMRVKKDGPYSDAENYLDVYTRLFREDCLSSLRDGVIKLRKGEQVNPLDMDVFEDVRLQGVSVAKQSSDCGYSLEVKLRKPRGRKYFDWRGAASLMFGNLLCLSADKKFKHFLWATVVKVLTERLKLKNWCCVLIEPLPSEAAAMDHNLLREMLSAKEGFLMVASPVYYRSYHPILKALQGLNAKALAFQEELVNVNFARAHPPAYIKQEDTINVQPLLKSWSHSPTITVEILIEHLLAKGHKTIRFDKPEKHSVVAHADGAVQDYHSRLSKSISAGNEWKVSEQQKVKHDQMVVGQAEVTSNAVCLSVLNGAADSQRGGDSDVNRSTAHSFLRQTTDDKDKFTQVSFGDFEPAVATTKPTLVAEESQAVTSVTKQSVSNAEITSFNMSAWHSKEVNEKSMASGLATLAAGATSDHKLERVDVVEQPWWDLDFELDPSQCHALAMALINRLAVIQGPPGTGKTYIGVKLVQLLLSMENLPKHAPIVVITYKNHCLDEFLLACIRNGVREVARIGGGCAEELEKYSLRHLSKQFSAPHLEMRHLYKEVDECRSAAQLSARVLHQANNLSAQRIPEQLFLDYLTDEQIHDLVFGYSWPADDAPDESGWTHVGKKGAKMPPFRQSHARIWKDAFSHNQMTVRWLLRSRRFSTQNVKARQSGGEAGKTEAFSYQDLGKDVHDAFSFAWSSWLPSPSQFQKFARLADEQHCNRSQEAEEMEEAPSGSYDSQEVIDLEQLDRALEKEEREAERVSAFGRFKADKLDVEQIIAKGTAREDAAILQALQESSEDKGDVMSMESLWEMSPQQRVICCYRLLAMHQAGCQQRLEHALEYYSWAYGQLKDAQQEKSFLALKKVQLVGMTVTGASINYNLLMRLKPAVVIVEEAAEVLEAQLIPLLGCGLEHLVLIGDHQQLRPQVENYELVKTYNMDVSMMERMVRNKISHGCLAMQSRMHPEIGDLLLDIYPDLKHNMAVVSKRHLAAPPSLQNFLFFWHHESPEQAARSYTNPEEAQRVVRLVHYLICQGCHPESITVLAAYGGQMRLLRDMLRGTPSLSKVCVTTIDRYQGDENNIIVISLVRSNDRGKRGLGFLNTVNRCTVAQSRARSAMYMVGNANTLRHAPHWNSLLEKLEKCDRLGKQLLLNCPRHKNVVIQASSGKDIRIGTSFCKEPCPLLMHCRRYDHPCPHLCQPPHSHEEEAHPCKVLVKVTCPGCSSENNWPCSRKLNDRRCQQHVSVTCERCNKATEWKCFEVMEKKNVCKLLVEKTCSSCGRPDKFPCNVAKTSVCVLPVEKKCEKCGVVSRPPCHAREKAECQERVQVECKKCHKMIEKSCSDRTVPKCRHMTTEKCPHCGRTNKWPCWMDEADRRCQEKIMFKRPDCRHSAMRLCNQSESSCDIEPCKELVKWHCKSCKVPKELACSAVHSYQCTAQVTVTCPHCSARAEVECAVARAFVCTRLTEVQCKECRGFMTYPCHKRDNPPPCKRTITFKKSPCGHSCQRFCSQSETDVCCKQQCERDLPCGHPCRQLCGDQCTSVPCSACEQLRLAKADVTRALKEKAARDHLEAALVQLKQKVSEGKLSGTSRECLKEDSSEYFTIQDMVLKYIQPAHDWVPNVTRIERVENVTLFERFCQAHLGLHDVTAHPERKFHGTSSDAVEAIVVGGFSLPKKAGMFGKGIYFATDSSKSAQYSGKASGQLLVCEVLLGKVYRAEEADPSINYKSLHQKGFDSVFAPRNTRRPGQQGVRFDEYVVYHPDQALPKYIVHFESLQLSQSAELLVKPVMAQQRIKRVRLQKNRRHVDLSDPLEIRYRIAESQFRRLIDKKHVVHANTDIDFIEYVTNTELQAKFERKKKQLELKYNAGEQDFTKPILAFHGTAVTNVDSIVCGNFSADRIARGKFGKGFYFSEYPSYSLSYGEKLLLCQVLPGRPFTCVSTDMMRLTNLQDGYDSHIYHDGTEWVVFDADQILPEYIIHVKHSTG